MSVKASNWVWYQPLKPTPKLVLMRLADFAGQDGKCYASFNRLIKDVCVSKNTIIRALKELEENGFITKIRNQRKNMGHAANSYILNMHIQDVVYPSAKTEQGGSTKNEQGLVPTVEQGKELTLKQKKRKKKKKIKKTFPEPDYNFQFINKQYWIDIFSLQLFEPHKKPDHKSDCNCDYCQKTRLWHECHNNKKIKACG
jgi:DNA-binding transcriptional regulator YhcF (GntR family)